MQAIRERYNTLAVWFYHFYKGTFRNCSVVPYISYATNMTITRFPKIAYQNPFEEAYTRPTVKYNAPIVISMILATLWVSRKAVWE